ncbi:MAG: CHAT domain-containing protein [Bacteroidota bacterium]
MRNHTIVKPAILLAFADSREDLPQLKEERIALDDILTNDFAVLQKDRATHKRIEAVLRSQGQDLRIFHFGGHADEEKLAFLMDEGQDGSAYVKGLAQLLGAQKGIELVFLNGCFTRDQVRYFHQAGVPAVIATNIVIGDRMGREFAELFYRNFVGGNQRMGLREAFEQASFQFLSRYNDAFSASHTRGLYLDEQEDEQPHFPYTLHTRNLQADKLCYRDLTRTAPGPEKPPPFMAHLLLNRDAANEHFQDYATTHIEANQSGPMVSLVQGQEIQMPQALCQRFREFTVQTTFEELDEVLSEARFKRETIEMPQKKDYNHPDKALNLIKNQLRKQLNINISGREVGKLALPQLLTTLDSSWEVVLIEHIWYAADWIDAKTPGLLEQYLGEFWHLATDKQAFWGNEEWKELPVIVLLFSMEHAPQKGWFKRRNSLINKVADSFAPFGLTIQQLESVPREDMRRWNKKFAADQPNLTAEIYEKGRPLPMIQVLPRLEQIIRNYWQR